MAATDTAAVAMTVNGKPVTANIDPRTLLVQLLRENLRLTGTHVGCDTSQCGACVVHVDGRAIKSCTALAVSLEGAEVTTIEGISAKGPHPVQKAWMQLNVPQCGYCQSGQIMSAVAWLSTNRSPSDQQIDEAMSGNICRCGTYQRIRAAIKAAAEASREHD